MEVRIYPEKTIYIHPYGQEIYVFYINSRIWERAWTSVDKLGGWTDEEVPVEEVVPELKHWRAQTWLSLKGYSIH